MKCIQKSKPMQIDKTYVDRHYIWKTKVSINICHHGKEFWNFYSSIIIGWDGLGLVKIDILILALLLTMFDFWQTSVPLRLPINEVSYT